MMMTRYLVECVGHKLTVPNKESSYHPILPAVRYRCAANASMTMIKVRNISGITLQAARILVSIITTEPENVHDPPVVLGTLTTRIE